MTTWTMNLYFMRTKRAKWLCDIDTIPAMRAFFIGYKSPQDILRRIEPLLYTENEISKYSHNNKGPKKLDKIEEWCKITKKSHQCFQDSVRNHIPTKEASYLYYYESIGKCCHRKYHSMRTVFDFLSHVHFIENGKDSERKGK